jgi:hypothetical protein
MSLTPGELGLGALVMGLLGVGGGVFWGGKGKVSQSVCQTRHEGLDALIKAQFAEVREDLKEIKGELRLRNGK